jgi:hypothetical protein
VKHQHILTITALTLALLSACGTTQPTLSQLPQGLPTGVQTAPSNNGRLGARAITNLLQETSLSAWGKKANVTLTDLNGFTKVGITDATTGWTGRAIPNSSAGDTYTATLEVKGTGTIQLFLQKGGGDFAQYTNKNITLSGTATTVTITTLKPADGFALQVGMTNITSASNLEARNLVVTKGVADTTGGSTTTPVTVAALSSWAKGTGVSVVDNGDTFYKITTTSASFVNTPVTVAAGQTYRYSATFKGTGSVNLFWQQRGGAYTQYAEKTFSLSGTAQTITFDTVIPSDGAPAQIGIGSIATTDTVFVKDVKVEGLNVQDQTPPTVTNFVVSNPYNNKIEIKVDFSEPVSRERSFLEANQVPKVLQVAWQADNRSATWHILMGDGDPMPSQVSVFFVDENLNRTKVTRSLDVPLQTKDFETPTSLTALSQTLSNASFPPPPRENMSNQEAICALNNYLFGKNEDCIRLSFPQKFSISVDSSTVTVPYIKIYSNTSDSVANNYFPITVQSVEGNVELFKKRVRYEFQFENFSYSPKGRQSLYCCSYWVPSVNFYFGFPRFYKEMGYVLGWTPNRPQKVRINAYIDGKYMASTQVFTIELLREPCANCSELDPGAPYLPPTPSNPQTPSPSQPQYPNPQTPPAIPFPIPDEEQVENPAPDDSALDTPFTGVFPESDEIVGQDVAQVDINQDGTAVSTDWSAPNSDQLYINAVNTQRAVRCDVYRTKRAQYNSNRRLKKLLIFYEYDCSDIVTGTVLMVTQGNWFSSVLPIAFAYDTGKKFKLTLDIGRPNPGYDYDYNVKLTFNYRTLTGIQATGPTTDCFRISKMERYRACKPTIVNITNYLTNPAVKVRQQTRQGVAYDYERRVAGPSLVVVPFRYGVPGTDPLNMLEIDGYRGDTMLEAKKAISQNATSFVPTTRPKRYVDREKWRWSNELLRHEQIMMEYGDRNSRNPYLKNPFGKLEIIVSDVRMVPFAQQLLSELAIEATVIHTP